MGTEAVPGRVYLVGAGPGDPELITVRGLDLLRSCDVVLYDRLVPPELLDEAPDAAERIFVGKQPGQAHSRQIVADALMIDKARARKSIVRLKGGDPFVFGRGGEELELLAEAGVGFEVVPGVTSAVAAGTYAGIPVTHRGVAASFAVVTANEEAEGRINWADLATGPDTLVLMMGVKSLRSVAARLIEHGRAPETPAAMVEWASLPRQRTVTATLETIAGRIEEAGLKSPATTIVGDVVGLRAKIAWFERRPLQGLRVVVTRARHQALSLGRTLQARGARVAYFPVIEIGDPSSFEEVDLAVKKLSDGLYSWVVFTSANGITKFFERVVAAGGDARIFARSKVAAVGSTSAGVLADYGLRADFVPEKFTGEELAKSMDRGTGRVLLPRVEGAPDDVPKILKVAGMTPEDCPTYSNRPANPDTPEAQTVREGKFDVVTFASASAVDNFIAVAGEPDDLGLDKSSDGLRFVACIGPKTAERARERGLRVDVVPEVHTAEGLADALAARFG
ncbi:MAG: uroporphyrinogen-III C-methyltransferase [Actinomycetota bacterium]